MKLLSKLACAAFATVLITASAAAEDADLALRIAAGARYTVTIEQTQTTRSDNETMDANISAVTALDILSTTPGAARWRYTPISYVINSASGPGFDRLGGLSGTGDLVGALMRVVADVGFECRVDEVGRCVELTNWPLWRDRIENTALLIDSLALIGTRVQQQAAAAPAPSVPSSSSAKKAGAPAEQAAGDAAAAVPERPFDWNQYREPILQGLAGVIDGVDARAAAGIMGSFHPPAAVQGRRMTRGQTVSFTEDWPMPFAAAPMRMTGTLKLDRINRRTGVATVTRRATLDGASAQAALRGMTTYVVSAVIEPFAPVLATQGEQAPSAEMIRAMAEAALSTMQVEVEETTVGQIDLATGMARETVTDMRMRLIMPQNGEQRALFESTMHTTLRITPGAPAAPRLPRAPRT